MLSGSYLSSLALITVERPVSKPCPNFHVLQQQIEKLTKLLQPVMETARNNYILVNSLEVALKEIQATTNVKIKDCKALKGLCFELSIVD